MFVVWWVCVRPLRECCLGVVCLTCGCCLCVVFVWSLSCVLCVRCACCRVLFVRNMLVVCWWRVARVLCVCLMSALYLCAVVVCWSCVDDGFLVSVPSGCFV